MSHQPTGRLFLGCSLALTTAIFWGVLPISLKIALTQMDSYSIVFYRFFGAALLLGCYMMIKKQMPAKRIFNTSFISLLVIASAGLLLNYIFYNLGLELLDPETTQVIIQVAPFLVLLGGVFIFKEPFSTLQKLGTATLLLGLLLFFNENLLLLVSSLTDYTFGVMLVVIAAVTWAVYALIQKRLLKSVTSQQLMLLMYILGSVCFLPFSEPLKLTDMYGLPFFMLLFCILNTLVAYGAFSAAMEHIHASQVSAIVTIAPIITFVAMFGAVEWLPEYFSAEGLNKLAYIGGCLVVLGSFLAAKGKRQIG